MFDTKEIHVTGVHFGTDSMQIMFFEKRHISDNGTIEQSLTIDNSGQLGLIGDIEDTLIEVIERFQLQLRNPPDEIPADSARARLRGRSEDVDGNP